MKIDIHSHSPSTSSDSDSESYLNKDIQIYCHADFREPLPKAGGPFCLGLHPWFLPADEEEKRFAFSLLEESLTDNNFFALGECGLDRLKGGPLETQEELFKEQLILAEKHSLSRVIIHCVRAYPDLQKIINQDLYSGIYILHDYGANADITKQLLKNPKIFFSLGRALTRDKFVKESLPLLRRERIFLETDDDSVTIETRYQQLAELWKMSVVDLESCISRNYHQITK